MKNLVVALCIFFSLQAAAQSFEGTITWTMKSPSPGEDVSLNMKAKNGSLITVLQGGMMSGMEMWFSDNNRKVMRVMRAQKMYVIMPPEALAAADKALEFGPFKKTSETTTILGYTCTKYTGELKEHGTATKISFWTTTGLKDDSKVLMRHPSPFIAPKLPAEVQGIPLKIETGNDILEVTEIKSVKLSEADFQIPAEFTKMGD